VDLSKKIGGECLGRAGAARRLVWTTRTASSTFRAVGAGSGIEQEDLVMNRVKRTLIAVVLIVALVGTLCTVQPTPAYASSDAATIAIILGGTIGGLMIIAVIITIFVRNNPAWMPAVPDVGAMLKGNPWDQPPDRARFRLGCKARDGTVALICW
jgi:hypothetical protein